MNKPGLHLADKKDSCKDECICPIDILPATEMSGNAHEEVKISFEDSYDNYDDDSVNVAVTDHSSRENVYGNGSFSKLKDIKLKNINHVIAAQLNINSLQNNFDFLKETVTSYVDILLTTESKLDNSFPTPQFQLNGFSSPYRLEKNVHGGGILLYVREDTPSKLFKEKKFKENLEAMLK